MQREPQRGSKTGHRNECSPDLEQPWPSRFGTEATIHRMTQHGEREHTANDYCEVDSDDTGGVDSWGEITQDRSDRVQAEKPHQQGRKCSFNTAGRGAGKPGRCRFHVSDLLSADNKHHDIAHAVSPRTGVRQREGSRMGTVFFETRAFVFDMATRTGTAVDLPTAEPPDAPYAIVAGLYVAALLAPAVVLALSAFVTDAGLLYISVLATGTVLTVLAGWGVSRTAGIAVSLGRHTATRLLAVLPFAWGGGIVALTAIWGNPPGIAVLLATLGAIGGMFLGLILTGMSRNRYAAAAVLTDAEEIAQWEARWPRRWLASRRRWRRSRHEYRQPRWLGRAVRVRCRLGRVLLCHLGGVGTRRGRGELSHVPRHRRRSRRRTPTSASVQTLGSNLRLHPH